MASPNGMRGLPPRPVRILSVPADRPISVRFLGGYLGLTTHWHAKRSVPCLGESRCPPTIHRARSVWKGYAPVEEWSLADDLWVPAVLEVTESLEHQLAGEHLRGQAWMLSRTLKGDCGPVVGVYSETYPDTEVRPAFSIVPILERFYHVSSLALGVPNPVPPKTYLEPSEGTAPKLLTELLTPAPEDVAATAQARELFRQQLRDQGFLKNGGGK